jgi:benzoyl-CoA reductase/2-hydroxyglutaryl-CoA dehydratase subunit BcrC/BadD/HgdB
MPETLETMKEVRAVNTMLPYRKGDLEAGKCHAPSLKRWKEQGNKVIGYQCTYVPEEVFYAAGILPVRLTGGELRELELEKANALMYINTCSFIRSCIELVIGGHYDFLDGFVTGST